ncbi:MAG: hypothetical protein JWM98_2774 [Thermoleophilia bacterium]|nr:hypothetical protein [Thermoleophilia bacterium]
MSGIRLTAPATTQASFAASGTASTGTAQTDAAPATKRAPRTTSDVAWASAAGLGVALLCGTIVTLNRHTSSFAAPLAVKLAISAGWGVLAGFAADAALRDSKSA